MRRELIGTNSERTLAKHVILIKRVAYSQVGQVSHRKHGLVSWRCRGKLANAGKWGFRASAHCCFGHGAFARGTRNFVVGSLWAKKNSELPATENDTLSIEPTTNITFRQWSYVSLNILFSFLFLMISSLRFYSCFFFCFFVKLCIYWRQRIHNILWAVHQNDQLQFLNFWKTLIFWNPFF